MDSLSFPNYAFKIRKSDRKEASIFDDVRKKYVRLTPEEWVRQHAVKFLNDYGYPLSLMNIEKEIRLFSTRKRFDILMYDPSGKPILLVECKAPGVKLDQAVFDQICRYNVVLKVPVLFITNGIQHYCVRFENGEHIFLDSVPHYVPNSLTV